LDRPAIPAPTVGSILFVEIVKELAAKHRLPRFNLGYFYSESIATICATHASRRNGRGTRRSRTHIDSELDATERIVAMAGVHPFIELLQQGADVIIGGRSSDSCVFAAPAIHHGFPKIKPTTSARSSNARRSAPSRTAARRRCSARVDADDVEVTAMHPAQRCTVASVAGHAMYERANPYFEHVAGGTLDMSECRYEQVAEKTTRITGAKFRRAPEFRVKLEGCGQGRRALRRHGRHPRSLHDRARRRGDRLGARQQCASGSARSGYELHYTVYGRDGIMGELEPMRDTPRTSCASSCRASRRRARWPRKSA
jgi:hypothetical protein